MERDTVRIYSLDRKTKLYSTMSFVVPGGGKQADILVDGNSMNDMAARLGVKSAPLKKEFIGMETINGYECHHYRHTSSDGYREDWIYEPLGITMQRMEANYVFVLNNLRQGPQPESLFELPADYKPRSGDLKELNAMIDLMQGKGEAGEALKKGQQDIQQQQLQYRQKTEGMTEQEKLMEALKMLGEAGKK
jgi:hypothetical protein